VQLTTDAQNVWIKDFLPPPYETAIILIDDVAGVVELDVEIPCEKTPINGTGELFGIRFTTLNPWDDGIPPPSARKYDVDIPPYYSYGPFPLEGIFHEIWYPQVCWNYINIAGYIDKVDGDDQVIGDPFGVRVKSPDITFVAPTGRGPPDVLVTGGSDGKTTTKFVWNLPCPQWPDAYVIGYYEFRPIPGDLDLDGHADIIDLSAIAKYYGASPTNLPPGVTWADIGFPDAFDLDAYYEPAFVIDIFDVVIVAKNICRTEPEK